MSQHKPSVPVPARNNVPLSGIPVSSPGIHSAPPVVASAQPMHNVAVSVSLTSIHAVPLIVETRVIPPSLFLSEDNSSADSPLPFIPSTSDINLADVVSSVPNVDHHDSHDDSIDDSLGPSEDK
jgi:hypothetical protein